MILTDKEKLHSNTRQLQVFGCYETECSICGEDNEVRGPEDGEVVVYQDHMFCKVKKFFKLV